jgi:hypothetical protein
MMHIPRDSKTKGVQKGIPSGILNLNIGLTTGSCAGQSCLIFEKVPLELNSEFCMGLWSLIRRFVHTSVCLGAC